MIFASAQSGGRGPNSELFFLSPTVTPKALPAEFPSPQRKGLWEIWKEEDENEEKEPQLHWEVLGPFNSRHLTSERGKLCRFSPTEAPWSTTPLNNHTTPLRIWRPTRPISMLAAVIGTLMAVCHRLLCCWCDCCYCVFFSYGTLAFSFRAGLDAVPNTRAHT